ncbi:response regulator [Tundrisphaera lichenicola]|uniref:response regulator n=1 Tax=Tundrisphaera lichenicola TaxID=2029860 RepID=UPI003EBBC07A
MEVFTRSIGPSRLPEGPYVLLVDDEFQSVQPLRDLVRYSGYASVATRAATDAMACCFHRQPTVVVTDLMMPRTDGRALAIRVRRRHPTIPIVLVTGQNLEVPEWAIPEGLFDAIFSKPLDFDRFLLTLIGLMERGVKSIRGSADLDPDRCYQ